MAESQYLRELLDEIGLSVHNINTVAIALSNLGPNPKIDPELNISWSSKDIKKSSISARRFAVRSAIVYSAEILYTYLTKITKDKLWIASNTGKDFTIELKAQDSKAKRFTNFCRGVPKIEWEWVILAEMLCHWRNRIVHSTTSKAALSANDRQFLESKASDIKNKYHSFDIDKAISDLGANKVTLKEATTLITMVIKCCSKIDEYYFELLSKLDVSLLINFVDDLEIFKKLTKQNKSKKRTRQIETFLKMTFHSMPKEKLKIIANRYT